MKYLAYRNLVDVIYSEDEAKAEAEEAQVTDGPDDKGNMFERPGEEMRGREITQIADGPNDEGNMFERLGEEIKEGNYSDCRWTR